MHGTWVCDSRQEGGGVPALSRFRFQVYRVWSFGLGGWVGWLGGGCVQAAKTRNHVEWITFFFFKSFFLQFLLSECASMLYKDDAT